MLQIVCRVGLCPRPRWDLLSGFCGPTSKGGGKGRGREGMGKGKGKERGGGLSLDFLGIEAAACVFQYLVL